MPLTGFWAVEGGDGTGKSGIVRFLAGYLRERGTAVVETREPGGTAQGERIRSLVLSGADDAWDARSELLLMTAARVEHVNRVILPALEGGRFVISDRFLGSTIAYQGAGRGLPEAFIRDLHAQAVGNLQPDLTVILDLDPAVGLRRSRQRLLSEDVDEGRFEAMDLPFHERIRGSFLDQARRDPDRHAVVDASGSPEDVQHRVLAVLNEWERPGAR